MTLTVCKKLVHDYLDLSTMEDVSNIAQLIEGALDCTSYIWLWGLNQPVLAGMLIGGFSLGMLKRVVRRRKQNGRKHQRNSRKSPKMHSKSLK